MAGRIVRFRAHKRGLSNAELNPLALIGPDIEAMLPESGILRDYVLWAVRETYAPPIFHLGAILPAWAWQVTEWGWKLPIRGEQGAIQTFLVGAPATAKSTTLRLAYSFHEAFRQAWEGRLYQAERNPWLQAEGTVAGLLETLADRTDVQRDLTSAVLFHEEVSSLLEKGGPVIDLLMQLFDAVPAVERQLVRYREAKGRGERVPSKVPRPAISGVFCTTTAAAAEVLTERHFHGGLVSRSLWLTGTPLLDRYFESEHDLPGRQSLVTRWTHVARCLPTLAAEAGGKLVTEDPKVKRTLHVIFAEFKRAAEGGEEARAASLQRAIGLVRYIAALYALSRGSTCVTFTDAEAARRLVEASLVHTGALHSAVAPDAVYRAVERAEQAIRGTGAEGISRAELNRRFLRLNKPTLDLVLAQLEEERAITRRRVAGPGRHAVLYVAQDLLDPSEMGRLITFPARSATDNGEE